MKMKNRYLFYFSRTWKEVDANNKEQASKIIHRLISGKYSYNFILEQLVKLP